MAENVIQFRLDARSAEGQIRALAMNTANVKVTFHAAEQMENRGFSDNDLFNVLRTGFVEGTPMLSDKNEWKIKVVKRLRGRRDAGVVTVISKGGKLIVLTMEWEDLK
jgi:hypothetical protein